MKALGYVALVVAIAGGVALAEPVPPGARAGQGHSKQGAHGAAAVHNATPSFAPREVEVIKEYYAPRYRSLPPGLQKKLQRTGHLPPGWEKRFEPFPPDLERQLVVLPAGYRRGVIDGHAVIFNSRTQVILDVAVLF